jgi:hypothetical protein
MPMTENDHPVDDALRRLTGTPEPTEEDRHAAEARLQAAIRAETDTPGSRKRRVVTRWVSAAVATAVAVLLLVQVARPSATMAAMEEIARVTEAADPLAVPPQQYVYMSSEITALRVTPREALGDLPYQRDWLVYLLPVHRESWTGSEGAVRIRTTTERPLFFRPEDDTVYYRAGLDKEDGIGETRSNIIQQDPPESWPEDIDALDQAIRVAAGQQRGSTVEYVDVALDIIRETFASPQLRANTLRLLGWLPDLELIETTPDAIHIFAIEYTDSVRHRFAFKINSRGDLLEEKIAVLADEPDLGIPAGTTVFSAAYTTPRLVDSVEATH